MTKIRTQQDFEDSLNEEWGWRLSELHQYKSKIPQNRSIIQQPFIRAGITILYAHWEGFIKVISELYLSYVSFRQEKLENLKLCFVALALNRAINKIGKTEIQILSEQINYLDQNHDKKIFIPYEKIVKTNANLRYDILEKIFSILGIDTSKYLINKVIINRLVNIRNNVAHGKYEIMDYEEYKLLYDHIVYLMIEIKNDFSNSAYDKQYLKN